MQEVLSERNQSISIETLSDDDYMLVDDLQKLTDEFVIDNNATFTPKPIWRPFIESLFEGIVTLDLDDKDRVLIGDLDFLKSIAFILASFEEEVLGIYSCVIYYTLTYIIFVDI